MKIPTHLKHKPVFVVENYREVDGGADEGAEGLSLGLAQWNDRGRVDISAKVWRYSGGRWSRQSEELPLSRVADLAMLTCAAIGYAREAYRAPDAWKTQPQVARVPAGCGAMTVEVCTDSDMIATDLTLVTDALNHDEELSARLHTLANMLNDLGYG